MRQLHGICPRTHSLSLGAKILLLALLLVGCEREVYHGVLASNAGYITTDSVQIVSEETVDGLTVRRVRTSCEEEPSSYEEWLELDGYYGDKGAELLAALLPDLDVCELENETDRHAVAIMNGKGGRVTDGASIGSLLRQHGVEAILTWGQSCRASCAGAFLGASSRVMYGDSSLHFNVPFEASFEKSVDCADSEEWGELTAYVREMLDENIASALLENISKECDTPAGRAFNSTAAIGMGLASED